jgi:hypothetical protein
VTGRLEIQRGRLRFQRGPGHPSWTVGELNVLLGIEKVPELAGGRVLIVQPGLWIDHLQILPPIAQDLLQFVAPILAHAAHIDGAFSLESSGAVFPLEELASGYCTGVLTIHRVRLSAGPLIQELVAQLSDTMSVVIIDECRTPFTLRDQKVSHQGLRFQLGDLALESAGTVGLDEQIQLSIALDLPDREVQWRGPLLRRLSQELAGRRISLPFRGTLRRPRLDWPKLAEQAMADDSVLRDLLGQSPEALEEIRQSIQELRAARRRSQATPDGQQPSERPLQRLRRFLEGLPINGQPADQPADRPTEPEAESADES